MPQVDFVTIKRHDGEFNFPKRIVIGEQPCLFLGHGNYNVAYKTESSPYRVYKFPYDTTSIVDERERAVRVWNEINPEFKAGVIPENTDVQGINSKGEALCFDEEAFKKTGWFVDYIEGEPPSDDEICAALIDIYGRTGRVICDAFASRNFLKTKEGQVVCIDIGAALVMDQRILNDCERSVSSLQFWMRGQEAMQLDYDKTLKESIATNHKPETCRVVMALIYLSTHRPDIDNVEFLKYDRAMRVRLSNAYTKRLKFASDAYKELDKELDNLLGANTSVNNPLIAECVYKGLPSPLIVALSKHPFLSREHVNYVGIRLKDKLKPDEIIAEIAYLDKSQLGIRQEQKKHHRPRFMNEQQIERLLHLAYLFDKKQLHAIKTFFDNQEQCLYDKFLNELARFEPWMIEPWLRYRQQGLQVEYLEFLRVNDLKNLNDKQYEVIDILMSEGVRLHTILHLLAEYQVTLQRPIHGFLRELRVMTPKEKSFLFVFQLPKFNSIVELCAFWTGVKHDLNGIKRDLLLNYYGEGLTSTVLKGIECEPFLSEHAHVLLQIKTASMTWIDAVEKFNKLEPKVLKYRTQLILKNNPQQLLGTPKSHSSRSESSTYQGVSETQLRVLSIFPSMPEQKSKPNPPSYECHQARWK